MILSQGNDSGYINMAEISKAMAHPGRVALLNAMADHKTCVRSEIMQTIDMSPTLFSKHIRILERAGIIQGRMNERKLSYCINWDRMKEYKESIDALYSKIEKYSPQISCVK